MNENLERLVDEIVANWNLVEGDPLTEQSILEKFSSKFPSLTEDDARRAVLRLYEQNEPALEGSAPLDIRDDGSFRYAPPRRPYFVPPPPPDSPEARIGDEPARTTVPPGQAYVQDLERILYSSAFRRLAGVTQVFQTGRGHMVHNRLTHTIKAGHIARAIANNLGDPFNAEVAEGAALAHDLGHPPFGHAGEKALDECVTAAGLDDGFEGNAQTFRILTKLSTSKAGRPGLNLTRRVLNAVLKYPWLREADRKHHHHDKWSVYRSEEKEFRFARNGSTDEQKSIDASVMDLADDIAYAVHDIEDAVRDGMIAIDELLKEGEQQREQFLKFAEQRSKKEGLELNRTQIKTVLNLFKICEAPLRDNPYENSREQRGELRRITSILHKRYILAARMG